MIRGFVVAVFANSGAKCFVAEDKTYVSLISLVCVFANSCEILKVLFSL